MIDLLLLDLQETLLVTTKIWGILNLFPETQPQIVSKSPGSLNHPKSGRKSGPPANMGSSTGKQLENSHITHLGWSISKRFLWICPFAPSFSPSLPVWPVPLRCIAPEVGELLPAGDASSPRSPVPISWSWKHLVVTVENSWLLVVTDVRYLWYAFPCWKMNGRKDERSIVSIGWISVVRTAVDQNVEDHKGLTEFRKRQMI